MNKDLQILINSGIQSIQENNLVKAELYFKEALKKNTNLNLVYCYLIPTLIQQLKNEEAFLYNKKFLDAVGENENYFIYQGVLNLNNNLLEQAQKCFKNVLKINSKNYDALVNLGVVLNKMHLNHEALIPLKKAISINPNKTLAYQNIGKVYDDEADYDNAVSNYRKALTINPNDFETIHNLSLIQLTVGDYKNGWDNYNLRWNKKNKIYKYSNFPVLENLDNLSGKKILIWYEQGLGDTIQFSRYLNLLHAQKALITFEVQSPLVEFFKFNFNYNIVESAQGMQFDFQIPLLSLPKLFGMNLNNTLKLDKFLKCKEDKKETWQKELPLSPSKINIGVAISGNPNQAIEYRRKIELESLIPLLKYSKIFLVQKEITNKQAEFIKNHDDIIFLGENQKWENFDDTSAIIDNLDVMISVDTSLTHLAGSMGKKTYLLLSKPADWRWGVDNKCTPKWYETVEIIRQKEKRNWSNVMKELEEKIIYEYKKRF